ncbi:DUF2690 domain-containing protein [Nonomuraea sp. NPDC050227]|uniref:DUF2690 domain-containing protein n=1 Tax=Nonomuraea sp. NPDC050227 TaxID=3364360 RepID=UPI0037B988C6
MPRPEKPVDPSQGPVQAFAHDLRRLRDQAGGRPYRELAKTANYSAAALAKAAGGDSLPSLAVTLAYVAACGGDKEEWSRRWHEAQLPSTKHGSVWTRSRTRLLVVAGLVAVVVAAVMAVVLHESDAPMVWASAAQVLPLSTKSPQQVVDGADPARNGCGGDAVTLQRQDVWMGNTIIGGLELRHSAKCGAGWARFNPTGALIYNSASRIVVHVETYRPADGRSSRITEDFVHDMHWSGMLLTGAGCLRGRSAVDIDGTLSAIAESPCVRSE